MASSNDDERINTVLKATIFYGHTIQVTKKEQAFVCIINNTFLLLKEDLCTLKVVMQIVFALIAVLV